LVSRGLTFIVGARAIADHHVEIGLPRLRPVRGVNVRPRSQLRPNAIRLTFRFEDPRRVYSIALSLILEVVVVRRRDPPL
jgi:hypothetical protein